MIGITAVVFIVGRVDVGNSTVRPTPSLLLAVLAAAGFLVLSQAVAALRWKSILGDELLPWSYLMRLYLIGFFFGLFLPTSVGGDAVRAIAAARSSDRAALAVASVLIDRGVGVAASLVYVALGLLLAVGVGPVLTGGAFDLRAGLPGTALVLSTAAGIVIVVIRRSRKAREAWHQGRVVVRDLVRCPRRLARVVVLALICQGLVVLLWYVLAQGVNLTLPTSTFLWAVPLVSLSTLLPVTFAGLGVREGVWLFLLNSSGIPPAEIVVFSLLYFATGIVVGVCGALLFVLWGTSMAPALEARS